MKLSRRTGYKDKNGKPIREGDTYVTEKIEAYNVAIEALRNHEAADGDPTGLARRLRSALAHKLDKEIQRWCDRWSVRRRQPETPDEAQKYEQTETVQNWKT